MVLTEKSKLTRQKLLEVAADIFVNKGFQAAGIREICTTAGANLAAVNYHFGGKMELYKAVLTHAFENAKPPRPMPQLADDPDHPQQQLRAWILWNAERMLGVGGHAVYELIVKELQDPTPAFDELLERSMQPIYAAGEDLVAAVLGVSQDNPLVQLCCTSVFGQCLIYRHSRPMIERFQRHVKTGVPRKNGQHTQKGKQAMQDQLERIQSFLQYDPAIISGIANHIADFSLAGIAAQAKHLGKK